MQLPEEHLLAASEGAIAACTADVTAVDLLQQSDREFPAHLISHSLEDAAVGADASATEGLQQSDTDAAAHLISYSQEEDAAVTASSSPAERPQQSDMGINNQLFSQNQEDAPTFMIADPDVASAVTESVAVSITEQPAGIDAAVPGTPVHKNTDTLSFLQDVPLGDSAVAQHAIGYDQALTAPQDHSTDVTSSCHDKPSSDSIDSNAAAATVNVFNTTPLAPEDLQLTITHDAADESSSLASDATDMPSGHHHHHLAAEGEAPELFATTSMFTDPSEDASGVVYEAANVTDRGVIAAEGMPSHTVDEGASPVQPIDLPQENQASLPTGPGTQPPSECVSQVRFSCCIACWRSVAFLHVIAIRSKHELRLLNLKMPVTVYLFERMLSNDHLACSHTRHHVCSFLHAVICARNVFRHANTAHACGSPGLAI